MAPEGLRERVSLAAWTTLGVGGPARWFLPWETHGVLRAGLAFAAAERVPWWVIGGGSNLLVADAGLPGLVLHATGQSLLVVHEDADHLTVQADAGLAWDALVAWAVHRGLGGIECLAGIPGQVGAAPIQNIGAYGQEVAEVLANVTVLDTVDNSVRAWPAEQCGFGYRDSVWKRTPGRWIVTHVTLRLRKNAVPCVKYAQVAQALEGVALAPGQEGLTAVRATVLRLRREKGMVVDAADPDSRSAGSFFVNPVVDAAIAERVRALLANGGAMPSWPAPGGVKLSAAWLIEHSGMSRGFGSGRVGLSTKHTLALVNRGGATAADVLAFAHEVVERVEAVSGVRLQREPVLLGA